MSANKKKILVTRFSAMGDVAMTSPVVEAVCRRYPEAEITYVTNPFFRPFFPEAENLRFFDTDFKRRHKGLKGVYKLYRELRREGPYHTVVDLHDVLRTKLLRTLFRFSGVKVVKIDKGRKEKKALTRPKNKETRELTPTIRRYAEAFEAAGYPVVLPGKTGKQVRPVPPAIAAITGPKEGQWIGVAPFAQHKGKIYPEELIEKVIAGLCKNGRTVFIFGGGPLEKAVAESLQERYERCISVIGKIRLADELDLIANLDSMISMDSSAMHMASLVGTRVVSIWGATHPSAGFLGYGQHPDDVVQVELDCRPCSVYGNKPCIKGDYRCLTAIPPQRIVAKVLEES